jgi:CheY-like chemotaxis protein
LTGSRRQIDILVVEDSPADAHLIRVALMEGSFPINVHHVPDGVQAMAFLRREGSFAEAPRPNLVLLDLNMPRKDGREVLMEVKSDPDLRSIPVVPLTTSSDETDVDFCYRAGANAFITKPVDLDKFLTCLSDLQVFWFSDATLPPERG